MISKASVATLLWIFNKTMRTAVRGLNVDMAGIERVKDLIKGSSNRIVFVPLFKSYGDFLVLQYVNYTFGIDSGFTYGNLEDTPRLGGIKARDGRALINGWVEGAGCIYSRRNEGQSLQSNYVNSALLKEIIEHNQVTTLM